MNPQIRFIQATNPEPVSRLLTAAIDWMLATPPHRSLWRYEDVSASAIAAEQFPYYLGYAGDDVVVTFQLSEQDPVYWPEVTDPALYVHRIAVARNLSASSTGRSLLPHVFAFATDVAERRDIRYLRLDCDSTRPALGLLYQDCGFIYHSEIQVGDYLGARYQKEV